MKPEFKLYNLKYTCKVQVHFEVLFIIKIHLQITSIPFGSTFYNL